MPDKELCLFWDCSHEPPRQILVSADPEEQEKQIDEYVAAELEKNRKAGSKAGVYLVNGGMAP